MRRVFAQLWSVRWYLACVLLGIALGWVSTPLLALSTGARDLH